jgi:hypothetical protein
MKQADSPPSFQNSPSRHNLKPILAVILGHLIVNVPIFLILGVYFILMVIFFPDRLFLWIVFLLISIVCIYAWSSFSLPRWYSWAIKHGSPEDRLRKIAISTGLAWRNSPVFRKAHAKRED